MTTPIVLLQSSQKLVLAAAQSCRIAYCTFTTSSAVVETRNSKKDVGNFEERTFRSKFLQGCERPPDFTKWFPHHMYIGMKKMQAKLRNVDCVIEVHDARIPLSGRNPNFYHTLYAIKPHILLLNKIDLINKKHVEPVGKILREKFNVKHLLWTNLKTRREESVSMLMELIFAEVENMPRYQNTYKTDYTLMVIGIPNTGKSTLINTLRHKFTGKKGGAQVGARPGVTRTVMEKIRIHENPLVYILDTPGVLAPECRDLEVSLKMAICETVLQQAVDQDIIADYILFNLNLNRRFQYVNQLRLVQPHDTLMPFLTEICKNFDMKKEVALPGEGKVLPDYTAAAMKFTEMFRSGKFGDQFLDGDVLAGMLNVKQ